MNKSIFDDMTSKAEIHFKHRNGMNGDKRYIEIMGSGVGLFDFDNDGDLDIYLGQGADLGSLDNFVNNGKLYRNDLDNGVLRFTEVTEQSGLISNAYNMGVATGDINNDGFADIYLLNYGKNQMFLNKGDGTFEDISKSSQTDLSDWSISASFFDFNRDGLLDIYVVNYLDYSLESEKICIKETGEQEYCGPNSYPPEQDRLFMNLGDLTFQDITEEVGLRGKGPGLGVVTGDVNNDGWLDIYVTNDMAHNFLFINQNGEKFEEEGMLRGAAVNYHGKPEASMGVDFGDIDNDGDLDIFMTHLLNETNTLFVNNGVGFFSDSSNLLGLGQPSIGYTGFGSAFLDVNNDSWLDIIAVNGEVRSIQEQVDREVELPLEQSNQLFINKKGTYKELVTGIEPLREEKVSRGLAIGDVDNDGDSDVLITNTNEFPQLLINNIGQDNNWVGFELVNSSGSYSLGSKVKLAIKEKLLERRSRTDASYISSNDPRILFGLGEYDKNINFEVVWANGKIDAFKNFEVNRYHKIIQDE